MAPTVEAAVAADLDSVGGATSELWLITIERRMADREGGKGAGGTWVSGDLIEINCLCYSSSAWLEESATA